MIVQYNFLLYFVVIETEMKKIINEFFFDSQIDDSGELVNLSCHPKAKEWLISASRANYQELAKLGQEFPQLVRLQVSVK